jgi:hypothetical protein
MAPLITDKENKGLLRRKTCLMILLSGLSIVVMGSAYAKSKHVFFMGSLLEKGVLKKYLDDNCTTKSYKLCAYKDELPLKSDDFIWVDSSPLYKVGSWQGSTDEFNSIINDILTTPRYFQLFLAATARQAVAQAHTFTIGDGNSSFPPGSNVNQRVAEYFPREASSFSSDRQNIRTFENNLPVPNLAFAIIVLLGIAVLVVLPFIGRPLPKAHQLLTLVCIAGIVFNCLDCAAFASVYGRYGCKMIWLIPFCALTGMLFNKPAQKKLP